MTNKKNQPVFKISDVSKMLNISEQMLRYYEKNGAITPVRTGDGRYRAYGVPDLALMTDILRYKEWNINISEIKDILHGNYYTVLADKLEQFDNQLTEEIRSKTILEKRVSFLRKRLRLAQFNLGKYYVNVRPPIVLYYCVKSEQEKYESTAPDYAMTEQIYHPNNVSFFDMTVIPDKEKEIWWFSITKEFHDELNIKDYGEYKTLPEQMVFTSVIDIGEMGEFSYQSVYPVLEEMKRCGYTADGDITGTLIGSGNTDDGKFLRLMEVHIPIKEK